MGCFQNPMFMGLHQFRDSHTVRLDLLLHSFDYSLVFGNLGLQVRNPAQGTLKFCRELDCRQPRLAVITLFPADSLPYLSFLTFLLGFIGFHFDYTIPARKLQWVVWRLCEKLSRRAMIKFSQSAKSAHRARKFRARQQGYNNRQCLLVKHFIGVAFIVTMKLLFRGERS